MGAEIVLYEDDLLRLGKVRIGQILEDIGIIAGRAAVTSTCRQPSSGANSMKRLAVPLRWYS